MDPKYYGPTEKIRATSSAWSMFHPYMEQSSTEKTEGDTDIGRKGKEDLK